MIRLGVWDDHGWRNEAWSRKEIRKNRKGYFCIFQETELLFSCSEWVDAIDGLLRCVMITIPSASFLSGWPDESAVSSLCYDS